MIRGTQKRIRRLVRFTVRALFLTAAALVLSAGEPQAQSVFTQNIPLKLPKGVNGTQPDLALAYGSSSGNGMVGMGWQLTGLPVTGPLELTQRHVVPSFQTP